MLDPSKQSSDIFNDDLQDTKDLFYNADILEI